VPPETLGEAAVGVLLLGGGTTTMAPLVLVPPVRRFADAVGLVEDDDDCFDGRLTRLATSAPTLGFEDLLAGMGLVAPDVCLTVSSWFVWLSAGVASEFVMLVTACEFQDEATGLTKPTPSSTMPPTVCLGDVTEIPPEK